MTVSVSHRISDYLGKYSALLVVLSIFGSFHSAMLFVQSKLFCTKMLYIPLKKKEFEQLSLWRFFNLTIFEVEF